MSALVEVRHLRFRYGHGRRFASPESSEWTLKDIDLTVDPGSTLGIVGETGSGKSTLVRVLCGLLPVGGGTVSFDGRQVHDWINRAPQDFRSRNQMVFQSPANSFDPRMPIGRSLGEPIRSIEGRIPPEQELATLLGRVGLGAESLSRYPHQLSGGQLQRVAIARAISLGPSVLYADEPTSALDVSVQAQVLNLLMDLRTGLGLTLVMVSHDLAVISRMCERIVVMKEGKVVEAGTTAEVMHRPRSPYTGSLVEAATAVSLPALSHPNPNSS